MKVLIDDIIIKRRIRNSLGDLTYLMESIGKYGLLNPITVTDNLELIAGYRRLQACKALGWKAKRKLAEMCTDAWRWQSSHP